MVLAPLGMVLLHSHSLVVVRLSLSGDMKQTLQLAAVVTVIGWSKHKLVDTNSFSEICVSCDALWAHMDSSNSHHFSEATDSPLHSPNGRQIACR